MSPTAIALGLIALSLFLCCIFGGYIANDVTRLAPGFGPLIGSAFGGSDAPLFGHAVLATPLVLALAGCLLSRRIQQVPSQLFTAVWLLFFFFFGASTTFSSFKSFSMQIWLEWLVYGCALFAVVMCAGRTRGPLVLITAIVAGCTIVALKAILEYGQMRGTDPSWRVFAGWVNPNATAALLLVGFFLSLSLCLSRERVEALVAGIAAVLIAFAIFLTGSKGAASLGLPVGTIVFGAVLCKGSWRQIAVPLVACAAMTFAVGLLFAKNVGWVGLVLAFATMAGCVLWGRDASRRTQLARLTGCYVAFAGIVAILAITSQPKPPTTTAGQAQPSISTPIARVTSGGQTEQQSSTFRLNLWKSAMYLIKERPVTGWGAGTYRYESGRAGLTTSTTFAHNSYLQVFAESGGIAFALFVAGIVLWIRNVVRNRSRLPDAQGNLLAGVLSAVSALMIHSLVDSDLYYFGIGVVFFGLLGTGLLLSADSVAPEFVPKGARALCSVGAILLGIALYAGAWTDGLKSRFRYDAQNEPDAQILQGDADALSWAASFDGDAAYLASELKSGDARVEELEQAYRLSPSERIARALAREQLAEGRGTEAVAELRLALQRDPNNFSSLKELIQAYEANGDTTHAIETANQLVQVEKTDYFKVRSIPESVPTETYEARFDILAPNEADPKRKADLLAEGVRGMLEYGDVTAKYILGNSDGGKQPDLKMPGYDSLNEARSKLAKATKAANDAAKIYRTLGDGTAAAEMEADGPKLAGALGAEASAK
jgi:O-antigen ligase/tetratricopeptide (TPR) repeat protein